MSLDPKIKEQLVQYLSKLQNNIVIDAYIDSEDSSNSMMKLLNEIDAITEKIILVTHKDSNERIPSFRVNKPQEVTGIQFTGSPLGHEFTSLVLALLQVGGYPIKLSSDQINQIKAIEGNYNFETFISLSCHNCPDVVQALNLMALINPNINHCMIDGALFQDEVSERKIMSLPTIFLNGKEFGQGRIELEEILIK